MHTIHAGTEIAGLRTMMAFEIGDRSTQSPGGLQENRGMQTGTEAAGYKQRGQLCVETGRMASYLHGF